MNDAAIQGLVKELDTKTKPTDGFAIGFLESLSPLTVQVEEQTYYDDEIIVARQLTDRTETVTVAWQTRPATCTATHDHEINGTFEMMIHSPLKAGQRLLILPKADQQSIYIVDILT